MEINVSWRQFVTRTVRCRADNVTFDAWFRSFIFGGCWSGANARSADVTRWHSLEIKTRARFGQSSRRVKCWTRDTVASRKRAPRKFIGRSLTLADIVANFFGIRNYERHISYQVTRRFACGRKRDEASLCIFHSHLDICAILSGAEFTTLCKCRC